jgi:hypothetical protein
VRQAIFQGAVSDQPIVMRMAGCSRHLTFRYFFEQGIAMKKIVIAAALLTISASAHAGTYNYERHRSPAGRLQVVVMRVGGGARLRLL